MSVSPYDGTSEMYSLDGGVERCYRNGLISSIPTCGGVDDRDNEPDAERYRFGSWVANVEYQVEK